MSSKKFEGIWILYVLFFVIFPLLFVPFIHYAGLYFDSNQRAKEIMTEWKNVTFSIQPNMSLVYTVDEDEVSKMAKIIAREQVRNNFWHQNIKNGNEVFVEIIGTIFLANTNDGGKIYSNGEMFMYEYSYGTQHPASMLYNPTTNKFDIYAFHR